MLNHSENKLPVQVVLSIVKKCRKLGLKTLVCAASVEEAKEIEPSKPDLLGYEPPEFIGSRIASVSTAKPEVIKQLITKIKTVSTLVGAGVHSCQDVKVALELGAKGVLVASDVVLAKDPKKELEDLAKGFTYG
jgi:triosephosphate isomerase